ncbi:hypothetical protein H0H87_007403 [Tephrocybe sp. NHM501043]|nr:hypothetical protein H0H87_007403 [Tephrocybe sp. NHM501043]
MDEFRDRLFINGWERTKAVWTVPQGFGNETYWKVMQLYGDNYPISPFIPQRDPTGKEFVVQSVLGINHGGLGVVSWDDPTTPDIKSSASLLAKALSRMTLYITNPTASFRQVTIRRIDVGLWTVGKETLLLASNLNYETTSLQFKDLGLSSHNVVQVLDSGARFSPDGTLQFESVGSGAFVLTT